MKPETNHLINKLPLKVRLRFTAACEVVNLPLSEVLNEPGKDSPYVYFPKEGYISLIAAVDGSPGV